MGELERLGIREKAPLTASETDKLVDSKAIFEKFKKPGPKIFGLGLSRTGTKSLTVALHKLGYNVIHYPDDATTLVELEAGRCDFSVLYRFDGITDITVAPYYAQLDQLHPGSKFILTTREKNAWLASMARHYKDKHTFFDASDNQVQMQIRRFLRAAVYGCLSFEERRMGYVFDQHLRNVREYFLDRPQDLLSLDITAGDGWEKLCPFLGKPIPGEPFPSVRKNVRNCLAPVPEGLAASQTTLRRQ